MKRFMVPVDHPDGRKVPFPIYVGSAVEGVHPLAEQAAWLRRDRGLIIPVEIMDSFEKLAKIALENNVDFEELCMYAMGEALSENNEAETSEEASGSDDQPAGAAAAEPPLLEPPVDDDGEYRVTIPCRLPDGTSEPVRFVIGEADPEVHPLGAQAEALQRDRGMTVPPEVMESFEKLKWIALNNDVPFKDLVAYALNEAAEDEDDQAS